MDLENLDNLAASEITPDQVRAILAQIDLDIMNLVREGKLSALKYGVSGPSGMHTDRAANMQALLLARDHYQKLLNQQPAWQTTQASV